MKKLLMVTTLALMLMAGNVISAPVNINSASAEMMAENLTGIGLSKAQAIVEYRNLNGPFKHADELVNVKGVGLKTVEKNIQNIQVSKTLAKKS
ncbi:MAG: helix-hairpin-helix domain-containing protein [Xanthomonadales bacterium]|nr:helix-hairpin-helix domain-containing protein [Xanthomonadales bacterium]